MSNIVIETILILSTLNIGIVITPIEKEYRKRIIAVKKVVIKMYLFSLNTDFNFFTNFISFNISIGFFIISFYVIEISKFK